MGVWSFSILYEGFISKPKGKKWAFVLLVRGIWVKSPG
jgi:hypothetical protein